MKRIDIEAAVKRSKFNIRDNGNESKGIFARDAIDEGVRRKIKGGFKP